MPDTRHPHPSSSRLPAKAPGASDQPAGPQDGPVAPMAPGDEAPEGTPRTGEAPCPECGGSGQRGGTVCRHCEGQGVVTVGIGGA